MTADDVLDEYRAGSPLGRLTTIEEVAWAVGILLAPEAAALHGATLVARPRPTARDRLDRCRSSASTWPRRCSPSSRPTCFVAPRSCSPRSPSRRSTESAPRSTNCRPTRSRSAVVAIAESGVQAPFITLDLLEGRPLEQHTELIERMSALVAELVGVPTRARAAPHQRGPKAIELGHRRRARERAAHGRDRAPPRGLPFRSRSSR